MYGFARAMHFSAFFYYIHTHRHKGNIYATQQGFVFQILMSQRLWFCIYCILGLAAKLMYNFNTYRVASVLL